MALVSLVKNPKNFIKLLTIPFYFETFDCGGRNVVITLWLSLYKKSEKIVIAPKQMLEKIQTNLTIK